VLRMTTGALPPASAALAAKFECAVPAYCLMTNQVHLLLKPQKAEGYALLMKHLRQRYVST
jgi:putative transposase